jgi:chromosome partitioning protein
MKHERKTAPEEAERRERNKQDNQTAHVIVCGNEKGGAGKTTTAMHIVVALLEQGARVATIDLDGHQQSFTRYIDNRRDWMEAACLNLRMPRHFCVKAATQFDSATEREEHEFEELARRLASVEAKYDFVVIDTPGFHSYLTRLAHSLADTLVTPINESFVDLDVFAKFQGEQLRIAEFGNYALMVEEAREQRKQLDGSRIDWVVVRNRLSQLNSRNQENVLASLEFLSEELDFRLAQGIGERNIFREFFPMGLTALDRFTQATLNTQPTMSHLAARREVRSLVRNLRLPRCGRLEETPGIANAFDRVVEAGRAFEGVLDN